MARGRKNKLAKNKKQERTPKRNAEHDVDGKHEEIVAAMDSPTENLEQCLRPDEQAKLLAIFETHNLENVSYFMGVAVLGKFDLVKKAIRDGVDINMRGPRGATAVQWAIRDNNLEMADFLIARGSKLELCDENGDCALLEAAENAFYNENAVIKMVEGVKSLDVVNKLGNGMVHFAVRRQWHNLMGTLITKRAQIQHANKRGVTPLMLACAIGSFDFVKTLLDEGASMDPEDDRGCTALCYAMAHAIQRNSKPPCVVVDLLFSELKHRRGKTAISDFINCRTDRLCQPLPFPSNGTVTCSAVFSVWSPAFAYMSKNISEFDHGNAFLKVAEAIIKHIEDPIYLASLMQLLLEIVLSGEPEQEEDSDQSNAEQSSPFRNAVAVIFMDQGIADVCLKVMVKYKNYVSPAEIEGPRPQWSALLPLICAAMRCFNGHRWINLHKKRLRSLLKVFIVPDAETQDRQKHLIQRRISEFQMRLKSDDDMTSEHSIESEVDSTDSPIDTTSSETVNSSSGTSRCDDSIQSAKPLQTEPPPSLEMLRSMFLALTSKYELAWESDRIAGYPGFVSYNDSPLGATREEQLRGIRSIERQYLEKLKTQWNAAEAVLKSLNAKRYNKQSRKLKTMFLMHQVRSPCVQGQGSNFTSRWYTLTKTLMEMDLVELHPNGPKLSPVDKREQFVISAGGNFGEVEIGLENGKPVALKRIAAFDALSYLVLDCQLKHSEVVSDHLVMTRLIQISLNDTVLCTPLCEFNLGEYLLVIKGGRADYGMEVLVRQMALGLRALHTHNPPIIHGNLKPSNVLIDDKGCIRLAEFGIYKGLYVHARVPKSSEIWFSRENILHYRLTMQLVCSAAADIQVCAMLMHFLVTGGLHPFGLDLEEIVKSILVGRPNLRAQGCDLQDMLSWMLMPDPLHRPHIQQILRHVYFWEPIRRWSFLMTCACTQTEVPQSQPLPKDRFFDDLSWLAEQAGVKGDWFVVVKHDFPQMSICGYNSECPTGLLQFMDHCMSCRPRDPSIRDYFLTAFPALPLAIFRLLEGTEWLLHPALAPFSKDV